MGTAKVIRCSKCSGTGFFCSSKCSTCKGEGEIVIGDRKTVEMARKAREAQRKNPKFNEFDY